MNQIAQQSKLTEVNDRSGNNGYKMSIVATQSHRCQQYHETLDTIKLLIPSFQEAIKSIPKNDPRYQDRYYTLMLNETIDKLLGGDLCLRPRKIKGKDWVRLFSIEKHSDNKGGTHEVKSAFKNKKSGKIALITAFRKDGDQTINNPCCSAAQDIYPDKNVWKISNTKMYAPLLYWEELFKNLKLLEEPTTKLDLLRQKVELQRKRLKKQDFVPKLQTNHSNPQDILGRLMKIENVWRVEPESNYIINRIIELEKRLGIEEISNVLEDRIKELEKHSVVDS